MIYRVQIGAFTARRNAQELFDRLLNAGFHPIFEVSSKYTRVAIPGVRGSEMRSLAQRLGNAGFREAWIREE
jgi:cell division septation protein DedD